MAQEKITKGNEIKNLQVDEIKRISADQCNTIIDQKIEKVPNENDLNELRSKLNDIKNDKEDTVQAYFTAKGTSTFSTGGQPLPFSQILAQSNSGFDGSTGTMTVKLGGLYHFSASVMSSGSSTVDMSLMHNDNDFHRALATGGGYKITSTSATLVVQPGDNIYIKLHSGTANSSGYRIFTGFKISDL